MKPERAQELYSDYAEGTLTPALRQALEQHFEADPAARADYAQFSQVYALLEQPLGEELEAPLGFRAKILERAAEQQGRRETSVSRAAGWLGWWPPRSCDTSRQHRTRLRRHSSAACGFCRHRPGSERGYAVRYALAFVPFASAVKCAGSNRQCVCNYGDRADY